MNTVANTWVDILGGAPTLDEYQDPVDSDTVLHARVPASLIETGDDTKGESSMEPMVTRVAVLRVRSTIRVTRGQRIKDRRTGFIWTVDTPVDVGSPAHTPDQRVNLRRTVNTLSTAPDA